MKKASGCLNVFIIVVCVAICSFLVGKMLGSGKDNNNMSSDDTVPSSEGFTVENIPGSDEIVVTVTQEKLRELIQGALDRKFPMTIETLLVHENGIVDMSGALRKDSFEELISRGDSGLSRAQLFLLKFAPDELDFEAEFEASYHQSSGKLELTPQSIEVKGLSIPVSLLPDSLTDRFSVSMDDIAEKSGYRLKSMTIREGYITLYIE